MDIHISSGLPHILPVGATFFVTFNLEGAIPKAVIQDLQEQKRVQIEEILKETEHQEKLLNEHKKHFARYDKHLDNPMDSPMWLSQIKVADIVVNEIMQIEKDKLWEVICYCIMPNHVHLLVSLAIQLPKNIDDFDKDNYTQLNILMKRLKGRSGRFINLLLEKTGSFWQKDSYDHYIRNLKEFDNVVNYIMENPVKAKLLSQKQKIGSTVILMKSIDNCSTEFIR